MVSYISSHPDVEAREIFAVFSMQCGGAGKTIPTSKFGDCLRALGHCPSQAQISELVPKIDPSGRTGFVAPMYVYMCTVDAGRIDEDVFLSFLKHSDPSAFNVFVDKADVLNGFRSFDREGKIIIDHP